MYQVGLSWKKSRLVFSLRPRTFFCLRNIHVDCGAIWTRYTYQGPRDVWQRLIFSTQTLDITPVPYLFPISPPCSPKNNPDVFLFFLIKTVSISSKTPSGVSSKVMDDYCWIHSTFHVRSEYQGNVGCILDNVLAGRDVRMAAQDTPDTAFYQWVPFTLMFQVSMIN